MLHLDDETINELLDLASVTDAVGDAFAAWGRGEASTSQRVRASASGAMVSAMAAVVPPYSGGKIYATTRGVFTFVNVLFDMEGRFLCTLDGDAITRVRTAAASALAVRALASVGSTRAAVLGAGRQGWAHVEMLAAELPRLERLSIHGRRPEAAAALVSRARVAGIPAVHAVTTRDAIEDADIVVTITASPDPLFPAAWIGDGTLICAVGATKYDRSEIGDDVVERCASVICDDVAGSRVECGDLIRAASNGRFDWSDAIELHDVVAGNVTVARAGAAPVLFETQGVAIQDVAAAGLAYERSLISTRPN